MNLWWALKHGFIEYGGKNVYYSFKVHVSKYLKKNSDHLLRYMKKFLSINDNRLEFLKGGF